MIKKICLFAFLLGFTGICSSQNKTDDVLFTVDDSPVMASEFVRVYNKNLDLVKDESQKDIDAYLDLFINYQLKIKEAKRLKMDENETYRREFSNYKKQLTKNYLNDNKVTEALVSEAYSRLLLDVNATHILIRLDESETDTIGVYNELITLRNKALLNGFETVRTNLISDNPKGPNGSIAYNNFQIYAEDLGYFTAFKMVYAFENIAYNTNVGDVSMPFRTRFGYHILNVVDKRPSRGEVGVSHIMVANQQKDSLLNPEVRINEIYKKIEQGEKFESLAKQFSDDKSSAGKGGQLTAFSGGQLSSKEFEDMAFSLLKKDEISKPFKTEYGWHIIKLNQKKAIVTIDKMRSELEQKVKRDTRSSLINTALASKLKAQYSIEESKETLDYFETVLTDAYFKKSWTLPQENFDFDAVLFKINEEKYLSGKFGKHLMSVQQKYYTKKIPLRAVINQEYEAYMENEVIKYHENNLEKENEDFAHILKEYRDGLLLFDLMENEVWNAGAKDSIGLQKFYEEKKGNYMWKKRVDAVVISAASQVDISSVENYLKKGMSTDEISALLNSDSEQKIIVTKEVMEKGDQSLPMDFEFKEGLSKIYQYHDAYHIINVFKLFPESNKTLDETKGKVISDYQNHIEMNWLIELNDRYKVVINKEVLNKVKSQILN
ncbi:peptidylprolyl isomerase [Flavobacteriales bacterium 34_180_T64]|nr:peptidylprolyl isomerase [Flavobacteriales bacterium 34_180_T64]